MAGATGLLRAVITFAVAAAMFALAAAAPAGADAEEEEKKNGIDYTKPYIDDRANYPTPSDRPPIDDGVYRYYDVSEFEQAIRDLEALLETGTLTDASKAKIYYDLGRLYLGVNPPDYDKAIENLRNYIETADDPDPDAYFYLGQALALQGKYEQAIPHARKAIELSKEPQETHYRLLLFCHKELGNHDAIVSLAEDMVEKFGAKNEYLTELAEAQRALGRERDAFLTDAMRHELGFVTEEAEIIRLAKLFLEHGDPRRAARILEEEVNAGHVRRSAQNLNLLGDMWFEAREWEKARKYWTAHTGRPNGEHDLKIARTYLEEGNWPRAERHLRLALAKGGLKNPCRVRLLLAHTLTEMDDYERAKQEFERVVQSKKCSADQRREAENWVFHLTHTYPSREAFEFMKKVVSKLKKSSIALSDAESVLAIAEEALEVAKEALATDSDKVRRRKLAEYKRARDAALRQLNKGALEQARKDRAEAEQLLAKAEDNDLTANEEELLKRLDETTKRRVEALEETESILEEAEEIAAKARKKDAALADSP